ncbi:MAG: hypothetical protein H7X99_00025 [Saprospiraceae bacterium]|nr:hypothetical protein [Saprospiraceae bacterium]
MLEKCRILYKGDMIAGSFYLFVGLVLLLFAGILHYTTESLGFHYLSIGFFMFFLYSMGKGVVIFFLSRQRYNFYLHLNSLTKPILEDETTYTEFRIKKKNINRRRYVWIMVICSVVAFLGIFSRQKGLIMGTAIPIALISGIEFGIGLLNEFRLREYMRLLLKRAE